MSNLSKALSMTYDRCKSRPRLVLDFVFWLLFGWYCRFCAGIFVWIINIVHLPITLIGWGHRIFLETYGLPIDGWMLFFGSGCYIIFGNNCFFGKTSLYWILDIPYFTETDVLETAKTAVSNKLSIPQIESGFDFWRERQAQRKEVYTIFPAIRHLWNFSE